MQVTMVRTGDTLVVGLQGDWAMDAGPPPRFDGLLAGMEPAPPAEALGFDAAELGTWDSSLLAFLLQASDHCEEQGWRIEVDGLPEGIAGLLELARAVPEELEASPPPPASFAARVGTSGLSIYHRSLISLAFVGEVGMSLANLVRRRSRFRWRDFWVVVQSNSSGALPIVGLIAFLVGLIIAFLGAVVLQRVGAGYYVSYLVGYGMLREMGALMTGIIIAGRTGAAFAAELGSMKISEEIDALETMGVSPVDHLVLPRVLGLFVTMPLLTLYSMFVGLFGGMLVALVLLDLSFTQFLGGLRMAVTLSDALLGLFKGTVFGLIIGVVGCMRGMQTGSDASAVGRSATSAVVTGITLVILANAIIDWLAVLVGV
jgi:phospholipid/cholesterol/gamma-HCH transport system permease protein